MDLYLNQLRTSIVAAKEKVTPQVPALASDADEDDKAIYAQDVKARTTKIKKSADNCITRLKDMTKEEIKAHEALVEAEKEAAENGVSVADAQGVLRKLAYQKIKQKKQEAKEAKAKELEDARLKAAPSEEGASGRGSRKRSAPVRYEDTPEDGAESDSDDVQSLESGSDDEVERGDSKAIAALKTKKREVKQQLIELDEAHYGEGLKVLELLQEGMAVGESAEVVTARLDALEPAARSRVVTIMLKVMKREGISVKGKAGGGIMTQAQSSLDYY